MHLSKFTGGKWMSSFLNTRTKLMNICLKELHLWQVDYE
jgi:hypothetical protein